MITRCKLAVWCLASGALLASTGCRDSQQSASALPSSSPQASLQENSNTDDVLPDAVESYLADQSKDFESTEPNPDAIRDPIPEASVTLESTSLETDSTETVADAPELVDAFRILLPTSTGPLLVVVDIRVGDQTLTQAFESRIQQVMKEVAASSDSDEDSDLTWRRLFKYVADEPQQFTRNSVNASQYANMIRLFDKNRNKRPEPEEVAKFLFRNAGFTGPFRLRGSYHFRHLNRSRSALFGALDRDDNRLLDEEEIDGAIESIMHLDQDGDQRVSFDEVVDVKELEAAWKSRRSNRRGEVAMDLSGYIDWKMLSYTLEDSADGGVYGAKENAIAKLDENKDGLIDPEEMKAIVSASPDITIRVTYPARRSNKTEIEIGIVGVADELKGSVELTSDGTLVGVDGDSLRWTAHVADGLAMIGNQAPQATVDTVDANDDEGRSVIAPIWSVQVRGRGAESPDAVFAWLDHDRDSMLSQREVSQASGRLRELASSSGQVRAMDIPDSYAVQFLRGDPSQDNQLFANSMTSSAARKRDWPRWAISMDANRDGDISRAEFVGTESQFAQLDTNGDRFIDEDEAN